MIEPVALGQTRFHLPGLGADERGVAMGRRLLCLFTDIQRAMGFFRSLSRAGSLKDVLGTLLIEEVRSQAGLVEIAIGFEAAGSFAADPCAAAARAHQGQVFTGTYRQFVPYRDTTRPLGTDVTDGALLVNTETGYALYHEGGSDLREPVQRLEFRDLLLRMMPQAMRPKELREMRPDALVLRVPRGLWNMVRGYIWRRRIDADIAIVRQKQGSHFTAGAREVALIRCRELPAGALSLMEGTPGIEVYVPVLDNVLVQRGWRHPVALESCQALFPRDEVVLFSAARRTVERLQGPLQPISLDDTTRVELATQDGVKIPQAEIVGVEQIDHLGVEVRLVSDPGARGSAEAVIVPRSRLPELMAVVHLMPQALWFGSEIALAEPFTVVLSPQGVRAMPLGRALTMVHPRVYVPVGMRFSPPLSDELISDHFSLSGNDHIIFFPPPDEGAPFAISRANFSPLSRAAVHPEDLAAALDVVTLLPGVNTAGEPIVHHPEGSRLRRWNGLQSGGGDGGERAVARLPPAKE